MNLHYPQTLIPRCNIPIGLSPLWIYTTLKRWPTGSRTTRSLSPLWIYTTLKPDSKIMPKRHCLSPLWIYTTLKRSPLFPSSYGRLSPLWIYTTLKHPLGSKINDQCLSPLWIYTTLKPDDEEFEYTAVWVPYEFTLPSNLKSPQKAIQPLLRSEVKSIGTQTLLFYYTQISV